MSLRVLQTQPDSRLVALAREGHEPAFEALVRRYRKELLSYCRRLQPQSGSAEDALQQALLQAWKALRAGADVRDVRPWLYRIAHNVTVNHLRVVVAAPQEVADAAGERDTHELVEQRLQVHEALAGMAKLPPLQREVFVSTTLDGASHEEVATALGVSNAAIRGLIYRARATLRAAAAALMPSPTVHWVMRRAETRAGGVPALVEAIAGGGGAGVAAVIAKGGAVLTLAGAVAGAGGAILIDTSGHHRHPRTPPEHSAVRTEVPSTRAGIGPVIAALSRGIGHGGAGGRSGNGNGDHHVGAGSAAAGGPNPGRPGDGHATSGGGSGGHDGGSRRGPPGGSSGGLDGGSSSGPTVASSSGSSMGGSSGSGSGPDGGSSSGRDGGGSGTSDGGLLTTPSTSDGGSSSSSGGSSSSSDGSSGSGETTTTSGSH